jgi:hypothetical protein
VGVQSHNLLEDDEVPPDLTFLANRFGSDKGNAVGNAHHFTLLYAFLLEPWRNDRFHMLELGLQGGGGNPMVYLNPDRPTTDLPSVRMWLEYFPRAHCIGFDCADFSRIRVPRFTFIRGNLSISSDLARLASAVPKLRLVVDDASHASYHQQVAFAHLFERVQSNGFYVIEDLDYQPPYESKLPACRKSHRVFTHFLKSGSLALPGVDARRARKVASLIRNVFIHRNASPGPAAGSMKLVAIQRA